MFLIILFIIFAIIIGTSISNAQRSKEKRRKYLNTYKGKLSMIDKISSPRFKCKRCGELFTVDTCNNCCTQNIEFEVYDPDERKVMVYCTNCHVGWSKGWNCDCGCFNFFGDSVDI